MATKFAHRAACHEVGYWQSAGGDARSAEEIVEGTVNTTWVYHVSVTSFSSLASSYTWIVIRETLLLLLPL